MSKHSGLLSYDAFAKTVEDARIKTRSGGFITIGCLVTLFFLILGEWRQLNAISILPELVVDRDSNVKMDLNLDITFPYLPCDLLTLDIMDVSGDLQQDVAAYGFTKTRLSESGKELEKADLKIGDDDEKSNKKEAEPGYCGPCYGAKDQSKNAELPDDQKVCCNDCEAVRKAYAASGWAFFDGKNVEQCESEGYPARIRSHFGEGCRVIGTAELNRINGNLHFAPGASHSAPGRHVHDLSLYDQHMPFSFKHVINHVSFGPEVNSLYDSSTRGLASHPLDGFKGEHGGHHHMYSYYTKVVPTRYEYLNGTIIETNQFSATYHDRPLAGGKDDDHPNTVHARGGIPGLFFHFEIGALKVINKEQYATGWGGFLLNVISAIGGVLTVGAVLDRTVYAANKAIRGKKEK